MSTPLLLLYCEPWDGNDKLIIKQFNHCPLSVVTSVLTIAHFQSSLRVAAVLLNTPVFIYTLAVSGVMSLGMAIISFSLSVFTDLTGKVSVRNTDRTYERPASEPKGNLHTRTAISLQCVALSCEPVIYL